MAQARRSAKRKPVKKASTTSLWPTVRCFGYLLAGLFIGSVATLLSQGMKAENGSGLGAGLNDIAKRNAEQVVMPAVQEPALLKKRSQRPKPEFDFYTVLPEIEEVIPKGQIEPEKARQLKTPEPVKAVKAKIAAANTNTVTKPQVAASQSQVQSKASIAYILQVASYANQADAERLKAKLALSGYRASIQAVSIGNKGTFHRVRLGPFNDYGNATSTDYALSRMGHSAMLLKVSNGR